MNHMIIVLNKQKIQSSSLGLRDLNLKEEYRSDRDDIVNDFFFPCLQECIEYDRCVEYLSVKSLTTIAVGFENFSSHKSKLRFITGYRYKVSDLDILAKLFGKGNPNAIFDGEIIRDTKIQKLKEIIDNNQIELKIAIPNSEVVAENFSEKIGIFIDENDDMVAFTGQSGESFSTTTRNFESVDVFTSWNDKTRVDRKRKNFEELWENQTRYVEVYDFTFAENSNLLKFSSEWAFTI